MLYTLETEQDRLKTKTEKQSNNLPYRYTVLTEITNPTTVYQGLKESRDLHMYKT